MKLKQVLGIFLVLVFVLSLSSGIMDETPFYEEVILKRGILRKGILEKFFVNHLLQIKGFYQTHFLELVQKNPDPFHPPNQAIINHLILLLEPLCILGLLIVGLYLILISGTPWGRAFSKSLLPGLVLAILLIPLSSYLMFIFLGVSHNLTSEIFSLSPQDPTEPLSQGIDYLIHKFSLLNRSSSLFSLPFLLLALTLLLLTLLLFVIRYLLVTFLVILFPVTIFLYLFIPTREMGKRIMELTLSWSLVQVIAAIALVAISGILFILPSLPPSIKAGMGLTFSLTLIFITLATVIGFRNYLPG